MTEQAPQTRTPAARRRQKQRDDVRRIILDATEALLVEDGYDTFSIRRLVERCGYTAPTLYHHFGDKRGLLDELLEQRFSLLVTRLRRVPRHDDPLGTLRAFSATFIRFAYEFPTHYRLLSQPRPDSDDDGPEAAQQAQEMFVGPIEELAETGRLMVPDIEEAKQCLWAVIHGVISLKTNLPDYEWSETFEQSAVDASLCGLFRTEHPATGSGRTRRAGRR